MPESYGLMLMNIAILTVALMAQATAPVASVPPTNTLAEVYYLFLQGRASEDSEDLAAAADRYRAALELAPAAAEIRAELAGVYARQGDLSRARQEAERALDTAPASRAAHRLLGLIHASSLDNTAGADASGPIVRLAISHLERATPEGMRDLAVMLTLGELYLRDGRHERAISVLQEFLLDRPGYPQAVVLLVQAYRAAGLPEMADAVVRSFRSEESASAAGLLREIETFERQGEWSRAAEAWAQLVETQPRETAYRLRYSAALVNSGDISRGRTELQAIARDEPTDIRAWYLLTQVEQRSGRTAEAEAAARRVIEIAPDDARGPIALAMVLAARRDYRGVVGVLRPRVASPTDSDLGTGMFPQMATLLGEAWVEIGQVREGIRTLEDARKRTPSDHRVLFTLASFYERDNQTGRAERVFREIIDADPEHAPALNYLGYMLADRGRKLPEALTLIERAIAVAGENPAYLDSLGWAYYRLSRFEDAVDPLERAAQGAPDVSVIQDHLGDAYMKLRRYGQAAAAFDRALTGDLDGVDERALTRKRDRARAASSGQ